MTAAAIADLPTSRRPLPRVFDLLVVILAVQASLFAAVLIAQSLPDYRSAPGCAALWLVSLAVPLACVALARRSGGVLPAGAFAAAAGLLLTVDGAAAALVPPADRAGTAAWNWGAVGVAILTLAVFRPARDILLLAGAHTLIAVSVSAAALGRPGVTGFSLLVVANAAATPALAAAQYLGLYVRAAALRETALAESSEIQARDAARQAVRDDAAERLRALRGGLQPLLSAIADGRAAPSDPQVAQVARQLAADLRRELTEARSGTWLLPASPSAGDDSRERWPGITLLDPGRLLRRIGDSDRAALTALLGMLRHQPGWHRVSVALAPGPHNGDRPDAETDSGPTSATLTVVAMGAPAGTASRHPGVIAAARPLHMTVEADLPDTFVAEAHLPLTPPSLISARQEPQPVPGFPAGQRRYHRRPAGTA